MRLLPVFLALGFTVLSLFAEDPGAALTGERAFKTVAATHAQSRYFDAIRRARTIYIKELDAALKAAMAAGLLDDANAINALRKRVEAKDAPVTDGQIIESLPANNARMHFEKSVAVAQHEYARDLQPALKAAMAAGQLDEANRIDSELKALGATALVPGDALTESILPPMETPGSGKDSKGLLLTRYPMLPAQEGGNKYKGYVPYTDLGTPIGAPHAVPSVSGWSKKIDENAVVAGFIRIDQSGTYQFRTDSGYDRNELLIDGRIVCKFRDGSNKVSTVDLKAGLLPIVSVGYALSTTEVRVQWKPPGADEFSDLPASLFSH